MARWVGLEQFASGNLFEGGVTERWAVMTQQRSERALHEQRAPDGSTIPANRPSWAKEKGHDQAGFLTGEMANAMGDPTCIEMQSSSIARVLGVPYDSSSVWAAFNNSLISGAKGAVPNSLKMTMFVDGTGSRQVKKTAVRKNKKGPNTTKTWTATIPGQVARDFFGHDERMIERDVARDALDDVARQWGFT